MRQMMKILHKSKEKYKCLEEIIKESLYKMLTFFLAIAMTIHPKRMSFMIE
jgi:hypothetical protein